MSSADDSGGVHADGRAPARALVCEDEPGVARSLRVILHGAGYEAVLVPTLARAREAAAERRPVAAIIDLALPDGNGLTLCEELRAWSTMPIVIVSGRDDENDKVRALEAGADDYVVKPFSPRELLARLAAIARRAAASPDQPVLSADGLEEDLAAHRVSRNGDVVEPTPTEFRLLGTLVRRRRALRQQAGVVVTTVPCHLPA